MPLTQSQIDQEINNLVNRFTGQRIGFPNGSYPGECTAPIVWLLTDLGIPVPPMLDNRADGWGVRFPSDLMPYFTLEGFQQGKAYPRGTLLMWNSPHIAIVLADTGGDNSVLCFEQNADPDGAPCGTHTRTLNTDSHTCTYALIPIVEAPQLPTPYTVEPIPQKTVVTTHATNRWNLGLQTFDQINANPIASVAAGYQFPTTQKVHHQDGYSYYVDASYDQSVAEGINVLDCVDYVAPVVPYVPPAGALPVAKPTMVVLVTTVPTYPTSLDAENRNTDKSNGTFPAGSYYQFGDAINGTVNVGITNQTTSPVWISLKDNVAPIAPPPTVVTPIAPIKQVVTPSETAPAADAWKGTFQLYFTTARLTLASRGLHFTVNQSGTVADSTHSAHFVISLMVGQDVVSYGTVVYNGVKYNRIGDPRDPNFLYWFLVPISFNGQAILIVPSNRWINWFVHKEIQLKSIFTEAEPQYIDSILLKPFRRTKK